MSRLAGRWFQLVVEEGYCQSVARGSNTIMRYPVILSLFGGGLRDQYSDDGSRVCECDVMQ
jgi:hypothetical protein